MNLSKCPYCNQLCTNNDTHICKKDVYLTHERSAFEDNLQTPSEVLGDFPAYSYLSGELSHVTENFSSDNTNAHRDFSSEAGVPLDQSLLCTNPNNMNDKSTVKLPSFQQTYSKWGDENASQETPLESHTDCFQKTDLNEKYSFIYRQYYSTNSDKKTENNFIRTNSCSESMEASGNIYFAQILEKHSDPSKKQQLPRNNSFVLQQQTGIEIVDNTNGLTMDCVSIPKHTSENPLDSGFEFGAPANSIRNENACPDCFSLLGIKYELNENSAIRDNCMSYICKLCQKEFIPPSPLKDGDFANTQDDCLDFTDPLGFQSFNSDTSQKSFAEENDLKRQNSLCNANKEHNGPESGEQFRTEATLKKHSVKHLEEIPLFCKICDRTFTDEPHLNNHKLLHTGNKPFKCNLCEKEFQIMSRFKDHSFRHHRFNCDTCERRFLYNNCLIIHEFTHTGEKPPTCEVCGKEFTSTFNLQRHSDIHFQ